ncbi:hypothetical protein V498_07553, partial [Pseudogymnoascus sp. VKM F-4517 (FW-2822)]
KSGSIKYYEQQYTSGGQWDEYHSVYDSIFDYEDEKDCANPIIAHIGPIRLPILKPQPHFFQTEHIIEFQGMNTFFRYLSYRTIVPGTTLPVTPYDFFTLGFNSEIIPANSPLIIPIPYKQNPFANEQIPSDRIMDALGSTWNNRNFVLLRDTLNGMKKRLWAGHLPVADEKMQDAVNTDPSTAVSYIRRVIAVIHYLNSPIAPGPNRNVILSDSWDKFIAYQMQEMLRGANKFASTWLEELEFEYSARPDSDPDKAWVLRSVITLDDFRQDMMRTGLQVAGYP